MLRTIPRWRLPPCLLSAARPVTTGTKTTTTTTTRTLATRTLATRTLATRTLATRAKATRTKALPEEPPAEAEAPIQLRAYQEECIQAVLAAVARGQTRLGISLATGAGKTVVFTQLIGRLQLPDAQRTQTLILAHRRELVEQAARHCARAYPEASVEVEMGPLQASGAADVTVASVPTLAAGGGRRLGKFAAARCKLVLVDEAHHIVAPGYLRVLRHFGLVGGEGEGAAKATGTEGEAEAEGEGEGEMKEVEGQVKGQVEGQVEGQDKASHTDKNTPILVGVSATFSRFDGVALGAAIDEIVYHRDYIDLIRDGWLAAAIFTTVASTADLSRVSIQRDRSGGGDFRADDLSAAVNTPQVNDITVRTWLARAGPAAGDNGGNSGKTGDSPRRSTLVFCVDRRHVADLAATFRRHGVDAHAITGSTPKQERAHRLAAFQAGAFPVLLNCGVFTEGTDLPAVDCVVLARPTRSRNLLVQMIGRGLRLHAGKANCHVIDMVASLAGGVVTTPTLFGLAPETLLEAASVADMRAMGEGGAKTLKTEGTPGDTPEDTPGDTPDADDDASSPFHTLRVTDYESVFDLMSDTAGERHIHALTPNAWVVIGPDRYVLSGPDNSYLRIERLPDDDPDGNTFRAVELRALPRRGRAKNSSPFAAPRELCRGPGLAACVRGADSYAAVEYPRNFIYRYQGWRRGASTPGQRALLEKLSGGDGGGAGATRRDDREWDDYTLTPKERWRKILKVKVTDGLLPADLTRGQAADMITKIKHGARGQFAALAAAQRRRARAAAAAAQVEELRRREQVVVGPLRS